ncbi:trypsin zeta-like [Drosophila obscura]|uniref:trypsin zeta-like n=1 Tax=Drosophila obscura TaxID=7282 RepID=UPI001BB27DC7|nr:trypsin zeta-like [Drosophila obscura]
MQLLLLLWLVMLPASSIGTEEEQFEEEEPFPRATAAASIGHLASLRMLKMERRRFGAGHICAGSLIRVNAVLTAAQCFVDREIFDGSFLPISEFVVVLGTPHRFAGSPNTMIFGLKHRVLMQDKFDVKFHEMDLAVLILTRSVAQQHAVVKPIELADRPFKRATECQMSGWGRSPSGFSSAVAVSVGIPIIGPRICLIKQTTQEFFVQPGMLCANQLGKLKRGYCTGDAGGSLVCEGQLAGIVSWGVRCDTPHHPGIFTDVLYYAQWINDSLDNPTQLDDYFGNIAKPLACGAHPGQEILFQWIHFVLFDIYFIMAAVQ